MACEQRRHVRLRDNEAGAFDRASERRERRVKREEGREKREERREKGEEGVACVLMRHMEEVEAAAALLCH